MLIRPKKDVVGIDIGSSSVKLVRLRESKGIYHLENLAIGPLPPEAVVDHAIMDSASVVEVVRNLVENQKIKTKNVATSISGHSVIIRKIQLPVMTEEEMEASIQWEAEQYIPFEVSEVNLDFQILGPDPKDPAQMSVLLVAAKKDFVNDHIAIFKECGLNPVVMDVDCFAIENAFDIGYSFEGSEVVGLINMGSSAMNVNILKDGTSVFTRDIQVGGNTVNEEIQKRLGLSSEDAESAKLGKFETNTDPSSIQKVIGEVVESLSQEIQRSLDFFSATSSDEKIQKLFITGGASKLSGFKSSLSRRLEIPVEIFNPFQNVIISEKDFDLEYIDDVGPLFSVATGLAMRRLGDK